MPTDAELSANNVDTNCYDDFFSCSIPCLCENESKDALYEACLDLPYDEAAGDVALRLTRDANTPVLEKSTALHVTTLIRRAAFTSDMHRFCGAATHNRDEFYSTCM